MTHHQIDDIWHQSVGKEPSGNGMGTSADRRVHPEGAKQITTLRLFEVSSKKDDWQGATQTRHREKRSS
ncbi:hypothetical protein MTYM_02215 [Methylococcales bacterium]|nr:hypothetical protein MTYM_02215 [Methylococcales bacterium]